MAGHLFVFSQQRILGSIANEKKIPISVKQIQKMAALNKNDLIFLVARSKNNALKVFMTAKASTGIVTINGKSHYIRLKFAKTRTPETAYELCQGLDESPTLADYDWRGLSEREIAACLFNTRKRSEPLPPYQ